MRSEQHFLRSSCAEPRLHGVMALSRKLIDAAVPPAPTDANAATGADIYVYPTNGQSDRQLDRDRYECHGWAGKQTGYDPSQRAAWRPARRCRWSPCRPTTGAPSMAPLPGAVIGASVSGPHDAAEGAVVGAVAGAVIGAATDSRAPARPRAIASRQTGGRTSRTSTHREAGIRLPACHHRLPGRARVHCQIVLLDGRRSVCTAPHTNADSRVCAAARGDRIRGARRRFAGPRFTELRIGEPRLTLLRLAELRLAELPLHALRLVL